MALCEPHPGQSYPVKYFIGQGTNKLFCEGLYVE